MSLDLNQLLTPESAMTEYDDPLLMDHEADGIRELDNKLPRWWVWLFYFTIIFAAVYMVYYHVLGAGDLMIASYTKEMKVGDALKGAAMARFEGDFASLQPSKDAEVLARGKNTFLLLDRKSTRLNSSHLVISY